MVFNAAMADANGGTISQVLKGAAIGMATSGIPGVSGALGSGLSGGLGSAINNRVAAAMIIGGAMAKAQGGKFIDGVKGAVGGMTAGALASGIKGAYNAGATSVGAALDEIRFAFEDTFLPSAERLRGVVTIDDITNGRVTGSTGPIETASPIVYKTMPWFAERNTYTGQLMYASDSDVRAKYSREANERNERLAIGAGKAFGYMYGGQAVSAALTAYDIYAGFNQGIYGQTLEQQSLGGINIFSSGMGVALKTGAKFNAFTSMFMSVAGETVD